MAENDDNEIKIEDRRFFDREGNPVGSSDAEVAEDRDQMEQSREEAVPPSEQVEAGSSGPIPRPDFISILYTYVHSALIHMGEMQDPVDNTTTENLEMAQHMIDILELLQEKTKGNLNQQEQGFLENALFDLRMRYMQKKKIIK